MQRLKLNSAGACAFALAMLMTACSDSGSPSESTYQADVRRTSFGYPHIKANNEKGLGYGVGYAFAQDNFCLLAEDVATVEGARSKYFGVTSTYDPDGSGTSVANLPSDFFYKIMNEAPLVDATWQRQSEEVKDLVRGYAAGVNRYLRDTGSANLPAACKDAAWVRPINELDLMRMMRRFALAGSGTQFVEAFYAAQPPATAISSERVRPAQIQNDMGYTPAAPGYWRRLLKTDHASRGSNGVALGREATESGAGLLLGNPHFPWTSPYRFYQLHLTIPGKVDVLGASLGGFPVVNIGHNGNVAWTHTNNTSAHFTLFHLTLDPANVARYLIDGQSKALNAREFTVDSGAGGLLRRTYYFSEHGPLLAIPGLLDWTRSAAFAFGDANLDNDRLFAQWWAMNKAKTLDEFKTSIETIMGLPWVHAIATDRAGNAYYSDITVVPNVSAAKQAACIAAPFQPLVGEGLLVLAGNTAACKWADSGADTAGAPQKGIFAARELPSLMRTDFVQNSNDSAWLTNPAQPLTGYAPIISTDGGAQGGRTRIGLRQIADRLAGRDGLAGNRFSLSQLQQIAFSNQSYYASVLLPDLRGVCAAQARAPDGTDLAAPCGVLANWDGRAELGSVGWPLFDAWRGALDASGVNYWSEPFDAARPAVTPAGLRSSDAAVADAARQALAAAVSQLSAAGLDTARPWGQTQVAVRGARRIPVHGGNGNDIYNAIGSVPAGTGLLNVTNGSSFVITVSFETTPPTAQGWLTFSQSTDPASPYYADQTERFSRKEWITFPYSDAQIQADPNYKLTKIAE